MKRNSDFFRYGLLMLIFLVGASGCSSPVFSQAGVMITESHSVDLDSATSVNVQIVLDMGELTIHSGSSKLMEGTFDYMDSNQRPEISYSIDNHGGTLLVSQPDENSGLIKRSSQNRWNLRFSDSVPMDLEVITGAGNSNLNLSDIDLNHIKLETGAGNGTFDLSGVRSHDLSVKIKSGIGNILMFLPREMGVRVNVRSGIGSVEMPGFQKDGDSYVNDAFGKTSETIELEIESGIGTVELQLQ